MNDGMISHQLRLNISFSISCIFCSPPFALAISIISAASGLDATDGSKPKYAVAAISMTGIKISHMASCVSPTSPTPMILPSIR